MKTLLLNSSGVGVAEGEVPVYRVEMGPIKCVLSYITPKGTWRKLAEGSMRAITKVVEDRVKAMGSKNQSQVYIRSLAFYDRNGLKVTKAADAYFRVVDNSLVQVHVKSHVWITVFTSSPETLRDDCRAFLTNVQDQKFYSEQGILCEEKVATWEIRCLFENSYGELFKNREFIRVGSLDDLYNYVQSEKVDVSDITVAVGKMVQPVVNGVIKAIVDRMSGVTHEEINSWVYLCVCRNRTLSAGRVINTRLVDRIGQPIYVVDCGNYKEDPNLKFVHLVDTIQQARKWYPDLEDTVMPQPIQWSMNVSDYIWNPNLPVIPVSLHVFEHIAIERKERLPKLLQGLSPTSLLAAIKDSMQHGAEKACIDISYALPNYSRRSNSVSMMLPLTVPVINDSAPVAALVLAKTLSGYSLRTIITLEMAKNSVRLFRDPTMTWVNGSN